MFLFLDDTVINATFTRQKGLKPPIIMFVQSIERAQALYRELVYDGINVDVIHADRSQVQRDAVVRKFRTGEVWVLIATDLMVSHPPSVSSLTMFNRVQSFFQIPLKG